MTTGKLTKNFSIAELSSRGDLLMTPEMVEFVQMAQELRDWAAIRFPKHAKEGLIISNCYRTVKHNKGVGGANNSAHLDGRAMDIINIEQAAFWEFRILWEYICEKHNKIGGINFYKWGIHITDFEDKFGNAKFTIRDER